MRQRTSRRNGTSPGRYVACLPRLAGTRAGDRRVHRQQQPKRRHIARRRARHASPPEKGTRGMKQEHRFDRGLRAFAPPLARSVLALALAGLMLLPGAASVAASNPNCTAEQGQAFIDDGQLHPGDSRVHAASSTPSRPRWTDTAAEPRPCCSSVGSPTPITTTTRASPRSWCRCTRMPSARSTTTTPPGSRSIPTRSRPSPGRASRVG